MPLKSDITLDASKFGDGAISEQTRKFNEQLVKLGSTGPKWWEVGAEKYRQMRWNGETPMPPPEVLESGRNIQLPSRETGREIPCRVFQPDEGKPLGVFFHIHGGGWVLQSEKYQDVMLKNYADRGKVIVVSVGYRLAPEHSYPAGIEDCFDIAEYLIDNAERDYGVPLKFMGGDSAGGNLSAATCYKMLETRPNFSFKGLVLSFGAFDIHVFLPQTWTFNKHLLLDIEIMQHYICSSCHIYGSSLADISGVVYKAAYVPGKSQEEVRDPLISPIYADMSKMKLPPALFVCGTADCLMDDSILMYTKWAASGAESLIKLYPGGAHNFTGFPLGGTEQTEKALADIGMFIQERAQ